MWRGARADSLPVAKSGGSNWWNRGMDRVKKKIRRWDAKSISLGGRLTLIKSVLSSIPLYTMSFLKLPCKVEKEMRAILRNFLWGGKETRKKVVWFKWEVCMEKKEGGLGIRDFLAFNRAILGKWIWRFLNESESLWVKVIRSRFGKLE